MTINSQLIVCLLFQLIAVGIPRKLDLPLNTTWNRTGITIAGDPNGTSGQSSSQLYHPYGISMSDNDILYIADSHNHRIFVVDLNCNTSNIIGSGPRKGMSNNVQFTKSYDVSATNTSLYILDSGNHRVQQLSLNGLNTTTIITFDPLLSAYYFYVDIENHIYVSDATNHRVLRFSLNSNNSTIVTVAGSGSEGSALNQLRGPHGLFINNNGTVYVADRYNHRIMKWSPGATSGVQVKISEVSESEDEELDQPIHLVIDTNEYMYISDCHNHRILRLPPGSTTAQCIIACSGQEGNNATQLYHPHTLAFDSEGSLYISEYTNNRVQKFQILGSSTPKKCLEHQTTPQQNVDSTSLQLTSTRTYTTIVTTRSDDVTVDICKSPCDLFIPCQNNGTCKNNDNNESYICICTPGFAGEKCEVDRRPCKENTCWNKGICRNISDTEFNCTCTTGWEGVHCEKKKNYCYEGLCQNNGVCRPLLGNYTCECLGTNYYGRHCEFFSTKIIILKTVSKSFGYVAIIALSVVAAFVIIMDILKYCFGIDPVEEERERMRREKQKKKQKSINQQKKH